MTRFFKMQLLAVSSNVNEAIRANLNLFGFFSQEDFTYKNHKKHKNCKDANKWISDFDPLICFFFLIKMLLFLFLFACMLFVRFVCMKSSCKKKIIIKRFKITLIASFTLILQLIWKIDILENFEKFAEWYPR